MTQSDHLRSQDGIVVDDENFSKISRPEELGTHKLHRLPWKIDHDGHAPVIEPRNSTLATDRIPQVAQYFDGIIQSRGEGRCSVEALASHRLAGRVLEASFQGRGLRGEELTLPEGFEGEGPAFEKLMR